MYQAVRKEIAETLMARIEALEEGANLMIEYKGSGNIKTFQNKIYAYLHRTGVKEFYRVYLESKTTLRIKRLSSEGEFAIIESTPMDKHTKFTYDYLDEINDQTEVQGIIDQAIEKNLLVIEDTIPVIEAWQKLQGREEDTLGSIPGMIMSKDKEAASPLDFFEKGGKIK